MCPAKVYKLATAGSRKQPHATDRHTLCAAAGRSSWGWVGEKWGRREVYEQIFVYKPLPHWTGMAMECDAFICLDYCGPRTFHLKATFKSRT